MNDKSDPFQTAEMFDPHSNPPPIDSPTIHRHYTPAQGKHPADSLITTIFSLQNASRLKSPRSLLKLVH